MERPAPAAGLPTDVSRRTVRSDGGSGQSRSLRSPGCGATDLGCEGRRRCYLTPGWPAAAWVFAVSALHASTAWRSAGVMMPVRIASLSEHSLSLM